MADEGLSGGETGGADRAAPRRVSLVVFRSTCVAAMAGLGYLALRLLLSLMEPASEEDAWASLFDPLERLVGFVVSLLLLAAFAEAAWALWLTRGLKTDRIGARGVVWTLGSGALIVLGTWGPEIFAPTGLLLFFGYPLFLFAPNALRKDARAQRTLSA